MKLLTLFFKRILCSSQIHGVEATLNHSHGMLTHNHADTHKQLISSRV